LQLCVNGGGFCYFCCRVYITTYRSFFSNVETLKIYLSKVSEIRCILFVFWYCIIQLRLLTTRIKRKAELSHDSMQCILPACRHRFASVTLQCHVFVGSVESQSGL